MSVLDTNILTAIMSARSSPEVAAWIAGQPEDALFATTICQAEILAGLAVMPEGRSGIFAARGGSSSWRWRSVVHRNRSNRESLSLQQELVSGDLEPNLAKNVRNSPRQHDHPSPHRIGFAVQDFRGAGRKDLG